MKVSDLQPGDIIWLYNSKEDYFAEFEFVQHNENKTSRLRFTGQESIDYPEYGYSIDSIEFRNKKLSDEVESLKIFNTESFSFKCLIIKEYFEDLFHRIIDSID